MKNKNKKVILFANGEFPSPERIFSLISEEDILIAVDGGLSHLTSFNRVPDLIIGDLDSADPEKVETFRAQGVEIRKYPVEKDETDLELALNAARDFNLVEIWITGALGKRIDQSLANIFLISSPAYASFDLRIVDGIREIFLIRQSKSIHGNINDRISLLPLMGPVKGIRTAGLYFSLNNEDLFPYQTRGISNKMSKNEAKVEVQSGLLLCIHETSLFNEGAKNNE